MGTALPAKFWPEQIFYQYLSIYLCINLSIYLAKSVYLCTDLHGHLRGYWGQTGLTESLLNSRVIPTQSISQSINQSLNRSIDQSINRSIDQSINQSLNQSTNQSDRQSKNGSNTSFVGSINKDSSINQSVNQPPIGKAYNNSTNVQ